MKSKTIQRMQLQMTAPLDIGLEQNDASLGVGQGDYFDLGFAEREVGRKKSLINQIGQTDEVDSEDEEVAGLDNAHSYDNEDRVAGLEAELDGLYNTYKERLMERDAKAKAKAAREQGDDRDVWRGISDARLHDQDSDNLSEDDGGWDQMGKAKTMDEDDSSSDDDEDEDEDSGPSKKRTLPSPNREAKKRKLVTDLAESKANRTTELWFAQDIFKSVDGLDEIDDTDSSSSVHEGDGTVRLNYSLHRRTPLIVRIDVCGRRL